MAWKIVYTPKALRQLRALDITVAARIEDFFTERVASSSDPYRLSEPLTAKFRGQRRFRIGDYRVICELYRSELIVSVVKVGHRSEVYD